jgi:DNA-directed RNA polymerase subunit F
MNIEEMKPLSLAETQKIVKTVRKEDKEQGVEVVKFLKKFKKIKSKDAKKMREELESLNIMRLKPEYIVKIIDILPENAVELNKISSELSLDEDDIKKILDIVKKY